MPSMRQRFEGSSSSRFSSSPPSVSLLLVCPLSRLCDPSTFFDSDSSAELESVTGGDAHRGFFSPRKGGLANGFPIGRLVTLVA